MQKLTETVECFIWCNMGWVETAGMSILLLGVLYE